MEHQTRRRGRYSDAAFQPAGGTSAALVRPPPADVPTAPETRTKAQAGVGAMGGGRCMIADHGPTAESDKAIWEISAECAVHPFVRS